MTGSLFLLAVAVICLPMLLDGAGLPARQLPDMPMEKTLPEVQALGARIPASDYVARVDQLRSEVDAQGFLSDSGTRFGEPVLKPSADAGPDDGAMGQDGGGSGKAKAAPGADTPAAGASHREASAEPADADSAGAKAAGSDAWAVQVASFARAANAEDFRSRLRKDGYEAFISTAKVHGQVLSRVAVGPLLDRGRAETLRGELAGRYKVRARLMTFSN